MLTKLKKTKLFLSKDWANSIINWLTGLVSPSGTIKIQNTANPGEDGGCQIDVNIPLLYQQLRSYIEAEFVAKKNLTKEVINNSTGVFEEVEGKLKISEVYRKTNMTSDYQNYTESSTDT